MRPRGPQEARGNMKWTKPTQYVNGRIKADRSNVADRGDGTYFVINWVDRGKRAYQLIIKTYGDPGFEELGRFPSVRDAKAFAEGYAS
jgi:hypothetical protein